jgi:predicted nucleotidyltransferase
MCKKGITIMTFQETKELSVKVIHEEFSNAGILINQVLLFGSRSSGNAVPESDWDFLVCVKDELPFPEKAILSTRIQTRLAEKLINVDIVIKSEARLSLERDNVGVITYYALKNGVSV